jgi:RNA polymerase sigma-70 factor (ECF subfamily)
VAILKSLLKEGSALIYRGAFSLSTLLHVCLFHKVARAVPFSASAALYIIGGIGVATLLMDRGQRIELLELLKCGDSKAWEDLVQQYQVPLSRYLYNMVKDKELARDLTQDTFLEAYQAMHKIEGDLNLKAWLYRIATNNAIQVLRRRKLISWLPWTGETISSEKTRGDYGDRLAQRELVRSTLSKMPEKYRAVLLLHDEQGFKCEEIGTMLKISLDAAKKRLTRAREMFQDAYEKLERGGE